MIYVEDADQSFYDGFFHNLEDLFEYVYDQVSDDEDFELPKHYVNCSYKINEEYPIQNIIEDGGNILDPIYYAYYPTKEKYEIVYPKDILDLYNNYENIN